MPKSTPVSWPAKTREIHNHHMNSEVWNNFKFRDDDIVIATYGKSGTTWIQRIISQLIFSGDPDAPLHEASPWVDLRIMPPEVHQGLEAQLHRRFVKTHLPVDALVYSQNAKYIYVARDGRDTVWSLYNHHVNANDAFYEAVNNTPGRTGPELKPPSVSISDYFDIWLENDGFPFWSYWENVRSWWAIRSLPNLMLMHFNDMKADLPGSAVKIAAFLDIPLDDAALSKVVCHSSFEYMKAHADRMAPMGGSQWNGGAGTFINKGSNGRWRATLTATQSAAYEARALKELGPDCASWLAGGSTACD